MIASIRFNCCSPFVFTSAAACRLRPLQLLLAACVHFGCCSPIASASTAAPQLHPLQLPLLPDCIRQLFWKIPAYAQCLRTSFAELEVQTSRVTSLVQPHEHSTSVTHRQTHKHTVKIIHTSSFMTPLSDKCYSYVQLHSGIPVPITMVYTTCKAETSQASPDLCTCRQEHNSVTYMKTFATAEIQLEMNPEYEHY